MEGKLEITLYKKMGLLKEVGKGLKELFGDNPDQYVEINDDESLMSAAALAIKGKVITKEVALELIGFRKKKDEEAKKRAKSVEDEIQILPSDKSSFRNDSTIEEINSRKIDTRPASELENHKRIKGGKSRGSK